MKRGDKRGSLVHVVDFGNMSHSFLIKGNFNIYIIKLINNIYIY